MQECNVTVRLGGSLLHTVSKLAVTPAEIVVLRSIHGSDAVNDIVPGAFRKRDQAEEFTRLSEVYGAATALEPDADGNANIVGRLFPGAIKRLPVHLKEIGLGHLLLKPDKSATSAPAKDDLPETDEAED